MSFSLVYKDKGLVEIMSRVSKSSTTGVRVGVIGSEAEKTHPLRGATTGITIGEVAMLNELGSLVAGVPQRSWLKSTFDRSHGLLNYLMNQAAVKVVFHGQSAAAALRQAGFGMVKEVLATIDRGVLPEQAQATIDKKGHDRTLIDTGTFRDSIGTDIVQRSGTGLETILGELSEGVDGAGG